MSEIRSGKKIRRGFLGCFLAGVLAVSGSIPVPATAAPNTVYVSGSAGLDGDGTDRLSPLDSIYDAAQLLSEGGCIQVTNTFYITGDRTYSLPEGICIEAADDLQGPIFQVEKGGKLTLNNIVINGKDSVLIANYGTVNVEGNVTFLKSGEEVSTASAVETDAAAVTYAGGARVEGSGMESVNWEQWTNLSGEEAAQEGESEEETTTETEADDQKEGTQEPADEGQEEETDTSADAGQEEEAQIPESEDQEEVQAPVEDGSQEEGQESESDDPEEVNNPEDENQEESIQDTEREEKDQNLKDEKGEDAVQETESSESDGDVMQDLSEEADESPAVYEENGGTDRESKAGEGGQKAVDSEEEEESVQLAAGIEAVEALQSGRSNGTGEIQKTEEILDLEKRIAALQVTSREDAEEVVEITKAYERLGDYEAGRISEIAKEQLAAAQAAAGEYHHTCEDISVTGNIPWYVQLRATRLEVKEEQEKGFQILVPYELKLWNLMTDEAYELPEGESAVICMPVPDVEIQGEFTILHHKSDGSVETLIPTVKGDTMSFETSSFSIFSVAGSTVMAGIGVTEENDGLASGGTSVGSGAMAGIAVAVDAAAGVQSGGSPDSSETEENPASQTESQQKGASISQEVSGNLASVFTGDETRILPFLLLGIGSGIAAVIAALDGRRNKKRA